MNPFLVKEQFNYIQDAGDMHEQMETSVHIKSEIAPETDPHILV